MHRIPVGPLLSKPEGFCAHYDQLKLLAKFDGSDEISSNNPIIFDLDVIKLAHEFTVHVSNLEYSVPATCSRCLVTYEQNINIDSVSRQYIYDLPDNELTQDEDVEHIDRKKMDIDIEPFVREELLLHFPPFPVCFSGCKGLCATCGVNLNTSSCNCSKDETANPFKALLQ